MKQSLVLIISLLAMTSSFAQNNTHSCGSAEYLNELDAKYPGMKTTVEACTNHSNYKSRSGTVTIPVVFHVVYFTAAQNLSNLFLNAQIDLLNKSYARANSDTTNMRSIYQSRVGPSKIRFILDQVIRYQTTTPTFDASSTSGHTNSDLVKVTGAGGDNAITPETKLNIWVCDLTRDGSDVLIGYAYPPAGAPNWPSGSQAPSPGLDGVVIDYIDIGGPTYQPVGYLNGFRGKACVHEVGHYLGLRHIWGDDGGACIGGVGYKDDGLSDTPVAADASSSDCDKVKNTCTETSGDLPDMVENYMDYSSPGCQNSFTKMQVSTMEYVLDNIRTTVRVPLGISETEELLKRVSIYPNPVSDIMYIDATREAYANMNVIVTNTLGEVVYNAKDIKTSSVAEIKTNNFAKGIYFVGLQFGNQPIISTKLIVQ